MTNRLIPQMPQPHSREAVLLVFTTLGRAWLGIEDVKIDLDPSPVPRRFAVANMDIEFPSLRGVTDEQFIGHIRAGFERQKASSCWFGKATVTDCRCVEVQALAFTDKYIMSFHVTYEWPDNGEVDYPEEEPIYLNGEGLF